MEKKIQGIKKWVASLQALLPKGKVGTPGNPRVSSHCGVVLETYEYEGYAIELRTHPDQLVRISAFVRGRCCLDLWYHPNDGWESTAYAASEHIPSYRIRDSLKQHALKRLKKE